MELNAVAELLGAQTNIKKPEPGKGMPFPGRHRAMMVWGMILAVGTLGVGSGLKILSNQHIKVAGEFTAYLMVINLFLFFFSAALMCYPLLQSFTPRRKTKADLSSTPGPTVQLAPRALSAEPSSVTEQTTEFLEGAPLRRVVQDTAPQGE